MGNEYKKAMHKIPEKVGIVTASTGAAIKDIISTIKRRYPICKTYLFPCLVQGEMAAKDIVKKINQANKYELDVLIVGRGGGSFEDLNSFNDEEVARAIFKSQIPVISAVGHEIDFTIADFVADMRAPTPTGAAEIAVPNINDLNKIIHQYNIRLNEGINKKINYLKLYMESLKSSFVIKNPMLMYNSKKQQLDLIQERLNKGIINKVNRNKEKIEYLKSNYILSNPDILYKNQVIKLENLIEKLEIINPLGVLKRGYTLTYKNDKIVKKVEDIKKNDIIAIKFSDGNIKAVVNEIQGG